MKLEVAIKDARLCRQYIQDNRRTIGTPRPLVRNVQKQLSSPAGLSAPFSIAPYTVLHTFGAALRCPRCFQTGFSPSQWILQAQGYRRLGPYSSYVVLSLVRTAAALCLLTCSSAMLCSGRWYGASSLESLLHRDWLSEWLELVQLETKHCYLARYGALAVGFGEETI